MNCIAHIRRNVLQLTQSELSRIAGVAQGTVSRWETGDLEPSREEMSRIRAEAFNRGLTWRDEWFFDLPATTPELERARCG